MTEAGPVVAAFDFDGTLTRGGSVWPFLLAMVGWRRVVTAGIRVTPRLMVAALVGGRHADEAKEALFRHTLGGLPLHDVAPRAAAFGLAHYRRRARGDVRAQMEWHRARGHALLIVSASPDSYLRSVGEELDVDAVIATRLAVDPSGRLTGSYEGRNCRGAEKIARVRQWMNQSMDESTSATAVAQTLWAYGNSEGDRQLLGGADVGIDVGRLGRFGSLRSFPRLSDLPGDIAPSDGESGRLRHQPRRK